MTWLRIIKGQWLIVAASDQSTSVLSLWRLASLTADVEACKPTAEAFLDAPVASGLVDVRDGNATIVIELRPAL